MCVCVCVYVMLRLLLWCTRSLQRKRNPKTHSESEAWLAGTSGAATIGRFAFVVWTPATLSCERIAPCGTLQSCESLRCVCSFRTDRRPNTQIHSRMTQTERRSHQTCGNSHVRFEIMLVLKGHDSLYTKPLTFWSGGNYMCHIVIT